MAKSANLSWVGIADIPGYGVSLFVVSKTEENGYLHGPLPYTLSNVTIEPCKQFSFRVENKIYTSLDQYR